jgi:hypothetical protein
MFYAQPTSGGKIAKSFRHACGKYRIIESIKDDVCDIKKAVFSDNKRRD